MKLKIEAWTECPVCKTQFEHEVKRVIKGMYLYIPLKVKESLKCPICSKEFLVTEVTLTN